MRLFSVVLAVSVTSCLLASTVARGDDLYPPPWRGLPGTTFAEWQYSTPNPVGPPDTWYNPYGTPSGHAYPGTGQNWVDQWGGRQGMWPLSGTVELTIPNRPQPLPYKDIWVQITWAKQVGSSTPVVWDMTSGMYGTVVRDVVLGPTGYPAPNDLWYHTTFQIHIVPNPNSEVVKIDGTLVLDQVVVDTICAPEPASMALLALGGLALLRRRPGA
jgi:hypothetical protein